MTTLLKKGSSKIMRVFYNNQGKSFHLRELSRKTSLEGQSIVRHLNFLEKKGLLQSKREGNQRRYSIKQGKKAYAVFTMFDVDRFEKLPYSLKQAVETYIRNLPQQPIYTVLFGSTAKGDYTKDSDIDILLVVNSKIDSKKAEKEVDSLHAAKISTFQINYKSWILDLKLKEDKVAQSAISTGYPILNHIGFYEALENERV